MEESKNMLVDVYFLMDATGSMRNAINGVKEEITNYVSEYCKCNPNVNLAYGLGTYRDIGDSKPFNFIQEVNTDVSILKSNLAKISASGGGDTLEGQVIPLSLLSYSEANWRPGSLRIIAWYGDHGAHEKRVYEGTTYTPQTAIANLHNGNMIPIALSVGNNLLNQKGIAKEIVSNTSGRYVDDVNYDKLCSALLNEISERLNLNKVPLEELEEATT